MDLRQDFLESYYQYKLESAAVFTAAPNPEEEPYKNLYKAREIYEELLNDRELDQTRFQKKNKNETEVKEENTLDDIVNEGGSTKKISTEEALHMDVVSLKSFILYMLATNYFDTDENGLAMKFYQKFLDSLSRLPFSKACNFFAYVQDTFNKLGLMYLNTEDDDKGMAYLLKSEKLYQKLVETLTLNPIDTYNTTDEFGIEQRRFAEASED